MTRTGSHCIFEHCHPTNRKLMIAWLMTGARAIYLTEDLPTVTY